MIWSRNEMPLRSIKLSSCLAVFILASTIIIQNSWPDLIWLRIYFVQFSDWTVTHTIMIQFSAAPSNKSPPILNLVFGNKCLYSNKPAYWVSTLIPLSAPNKWAYSVSEVDYCYKTCILMSTVVHLSLVFYVRLMIIKTVVHVLVSQLLCPYMWLHSSFKGLISSLKFHCSSEEGSQGNKSVFQSSQSSSKRHQSFVLHILLFLEKSKHPVPNKCPVLNIKYPPLIY